MAYASVNNIVVVTHEEYAPDVKRKVQMPNVCLEFDIKYANTFEMLREIHQKHEAKRKATMTGQSTRLQQQKSSPGKNTGASMIT